ncbi:DUF389 domain-containing protein [Nocardioides panzhihuensis]|uniref:Putative membrane protein n=1 Tax=Nocardioides panzhihuensis TaxID=860243 RepID=A0A7Z0IS52_9ACTN|nr:DUF389 domain-containing protein [Nocardioides panzhihuensis]NYI77392.1 putative membrane protein [Nocardioides panzhihuensis]
MTGALAVLTADVARITERLFLTVGDRRRNLTAFWVLLVLAGVIAAAGVVADSTATVIGAMIVAPLMTPILGTALALVLADRRQLATNIALVIGAAAAVILIGFVIGLTVPRPPRGSASPPSPAPISTSPSATRRSTTLCSSSTAAWRTHRRTLRSR